MHSKAYQFLLAPLPREEGARRLWHTCPEHFAFYYFDDDDGCSLCALEAELKFEIHGTCVRMHGCNEMHAHTLHTDVWVSRAGAAGKFNFSLSAK